MRLDGAGMRESRRKAILSSTSLMAAKGLLRTIALVWLVAIVVAQLLLACGSLATPHERPGLHFTGSYNSDYPLDSSESRCTVVNGNLRYEVHPKGQALPRFWVDIPYAGPTQSTYSGKINDARMDWGDYAGLVSATGTVTVSSETADKAKGSLSVQGYLYYEKPGPLRVEGAWACDINK